MNFKNKLISGVFIKRYKRFFVDVKINNRIVTAHCPNTGSMMGLLNKGSKVWLSKVNDPKRKLKYTLQIIENKKVKVGVNTHLTNKIVLDALQRKLINEFKSIKVINQEVRFGDNTRFDFFLSNFNKKIFVEVKNVTLSRQTGVAEFPDSITSRGLKHINELINANKKGYEIYLIFLVQRDDCKKFKIAKDIDSEYNDLLMRAIKKNLNILCFNCKFSKKGIKLNRRMKFNFYE